MLWLGGMFFVGLVGASVFRAIEPPALRQRVFHQLGRRFRRMAWWAIGILVVTGAINLYYRGWLHWRGVLDSRQFWNTTTGHALAVKLSIVALMIAISAVHDFILGPRAASATPGSPAALASRHRAALLARFNAILGVLLVAAAVRFVRGG
ncbi:hypothetical protein BH11GEM1_BH11GEM1_08290 [soil metagenome]